LSGRCPNGGSRSDNRRYEARLWFTAISSIDAADGVCRSTLTAAQAFDESKYLTGKCQWSRERKPVLAAVKRRSIRPKPVGLGQQAPLTPEISG